MVVYGAITGLILFGAIEKSLKSTWDTVSIPKSEFIEDDVHLFSINASSLCSLVSLTLQLQWLSEDLCSQFLPP